MSLGAWLERFTAAVEANQFVKIILSKPTADAGDLKSIEVRPILVKREMKLSFTYHHKTRDIVKNYSTAEAVALFRKLMTDKFISARLHTLEADVQLSKQTTGFAISTLPPSHKALPELSHNRAKQHLVAASPYLHALGLSDEQGNINKTAQDKFRQINKYIEILDGLIRQLDTSKPLRIVDMGAGKGYLTFALYDHLVNTLRLKAEVVGVEFRADLVKLCNGIAGRQGFENLKFVEGTIAGFDCTGADIVIALHACDTATDDAINKAIRAEAKLIVVAPCCHKQIRREMEKHEGAQALAFLTKFGTYKERIAEMLTDGLRAQLMELHGYRSNLFEFISDTHTPKNVMIVATRSSAPNKQSAEIKASIAATKAQFGVGFHQLEKLLAR